jgi:hypothetical protein
MNSLYRKLRITDWWHWFVGLGAFLWILSRSGMNPKRITYPCQQAAIPIAASWVLAIVAFFAGSIILKRFAKLSATTVVIVGIAWFIGIYPDSSRSDDYSPASLPVWEVENPISTIYVMDSVPSTSGSLAAGDASVPDEYLNDPAIDTILQLMANDGIMLHKTALQPDGIVGADNIVVIKGNFQWTSRNTTSTDRIKGLVWQILQHPDGFTGEILVCDNTQNFGTGLAENDNNSEDELQSIPDVVNTFFAKGYPVYLRDWTDLWDVVASEYSDGDYDNGYVYETETRISYPKFQSPSGNHFISMRNGIWDSDIEEYDSSRLCIINFPVTKAHAMAGATLAVKNWIGLMTTAYWDPRYGGWENMHYTYYWGEYALVARAMAVTFPRLTLIDAAWVSGQNANVLLDLTNTKMLVASTDPVAASWYAAKYIVTPNATNPGMTDPDLPSARYYTTIRRWTTFLHDSTGYPCTHDSSLISVYDRYLTKKRIKLTDETFVDNMGGDGDGVPEAGETVQLIFDFANTYDDAITDLTINCALIPFSSR